jgi:hypothetical protein
MRLSYLQFGGSLMPVVDIAVAYRKRRLTTRALIDSGADVCVFDREIATHLGVRLNEAASKTVGGIGGEIVAYPGNVNVEIGDQVIALRIYFAPDLPVNLLGRSDFFHHFLVLFDERHHRLELTPVAAADA